MSRPARLAAAGAVLLVFCRGGASAQAPVKPAKPRAAATGQEPGLSADEARTRYLELLARKQAADREAALWTAESDLAARRTAYAVLDLSERSVEFRVRGFAFKKIRFTDLELGKGSADLGVTDVPTGVFTLLLKEGRGVETESVQLKTLTPDEARRAGIKDEDTETLGAEQGEILEGAPAATAGEGTSAADAGSSGAAKKMVGVAGGAIPPDPPPSYHMGFEGDVSLLVVAERKIEGDEARFAWAVALGKRVGRWLHRGSGAPDVRITLHMPLADAQALFRQLLPGQRLMIVA